MKRQITTLLLLAIAVTDTSAAHAFDYKSIAKTCIQSGKTYACPEAYTKANLLEAAIFVEVNVNATFSGPDYYVERVKESNILVYLPSTWIAKVSYSKCAYAGGHSAEALHTAFGDTEDLPLPFWGAQSSDFFVRQYCDCSAGPP